MRVRSNHLWNNVVPHHFSILEWNDSRLLYSSATSACSMHHTSLRHFCFIAHVQILLVSVSVWSIVTGLIEWIREGLSHPSQTDWNFESVWAFLFWMRCLQTISNLNTVLHINAPSVVIQLIIWQCFDKLFHRGSTGSHIQMWGLLLLVLHFLLLYFEDLSV